MAGYCNILADATVFYDIEIRQLSVYSIPSKVTLTLLGQPKHVAVAKCLQYKIHSCESVAVVVVSNYHGLFISEF